MAKDKVSIQPDKQDSNVLPPLNSTDGQTRYLDISGNVITKEQYEEIQFGKKTEKEQ